MATDEELPGGHGGGVPARSDLDLERQALRQDWPIPPKVKRSLLQRAIDICDPETTIGSDAPPRLVLRALQVLSMFGGLSVKQQVVDLKREYFDRLAGRDASETLADLVGDAEAAALGHKPDVRPEGLK